MSVETLSRRLGTMRRAGWLQMKVCSKNREHVYSLSDLGERVYNEAVPHWVRAQIRLADALSSQEQLSSAVEALNLLAQAATQAQYLRKQNNGKKNCSDEEPEADCVFS